MPLPKPQTNEDKGDFMRRCMSDDVANTEYPESSQRYAVCESIWQDRNKQSDKRFILRHKATKSKRQG